MELTTIVSFLFDSNFLPIFNLNFTRNLYLLFTKYVIFD